MKKQILTLFLTLGLGMMAHAEASTIEELIEATKPVNMVEYKGGVLLEITFSGFADERQNNAKLSRSIKKDGDYIYVNETSFYTEDDYTYFYFSTEPEDELQYQTAVSMGTDVITPEMTQSLLESSYLGYESFDVEITSVDEEEDQYVIHTVIKSGEYEVAKDTITEEKETGIVTRLERCYVRANAENPESEAAEEEISTTVLTYSEDVTADHLFDSQELSSRLNFDTVDLAGEPVNTDIIKGSKLLMINFWEPWCGPCVGEMPEIQELYELYKDQGFLVLGVYSAENTKESVEEIVNETGVQYPILQKDQNLSVFCGNYVPVTIFADGEGNVLTEEPMVGAKSKEEWDEIIRQYLQ